MRVEAIKGFLDKSKIHTFIPLLFSSSSEVGSVVDVSGTPVRGGVGKLTLRIITRETHPKIAINKAHEIKAFLQENLKGAFFDGRKVLSIEVDTPEPLFIGEEDGVYTVSMNYSIIEG